MPSRFHWLLPTLVALAAALVNGCNAASHHSSASAVRGSTGNAAGLVRQVVDGGPRSRAVGFAAALSGWFAPEGVHVAPGPVLFRGPAGALAWLQRDTLNASSSAHWTVLRAGLSADARDAYTYGYVDVIRANGDTVPGKFHAYWRRSNAGRWELLAFSRGPRAPGAMSRAVPGGIIARVAAAPGPRDTTAMLREVMDTERAFSDSVGTNVAAGFGGFAAPDAAKNEGGSEYVFGPAAIAALFANPPPGALGPAWHPEWGTVAASGDLAFTLGPAWPRVAGKVQTPPETTRGRYFTIWQRQPNGTWRFLVD